LGSRVDRKASAKKPSDGSAASGFSASYRTETIVDLSAVGADTIAVVDYMFTVRTLIR